MITFLTGSELRHPRTKQTVSEYAAALTRSLGDRANAHDAVSTMFWRERNQDYRTFYGAVLACLSNG